MNETLRSLFPVSERAIYLNHAAVSAPPVPTIDAIQSQLADVSENGSVNFRNWIAVKENARQLVAGHARRASAASRIYAKHFRWTLYSR